MTQQLTSDCHIALLYKAQVGPHTGSYCEYEEEQGFEHDQEVAGGKADDNIERWNDFRHQDRDSEQQVLLKQMSPLSIQN